MRAGVSRASLAPRAASRLDRTRHLALEDIEVVQRDLAEGIGRHAEIHGERLGLRVRHPIGEQQRVELGRLAVVEADDELAPIRAHALQRMGQPRREVPQAALLHVLDVGAALPVDRGDAAGAARHVGPFGIEVPVQLADAAAGEPHVDARDLLRDLEIVLRHLARPATILDAARRVVEGGPEHGQLADIGRGRREGAGKLARHSRVVGAGIGGARWIFQGVDRPLRRHIGVAVRLGARLPGRGCEARRRCNEEIAAGQIFHLKLSSCRREGA